MEIDVPIEWVDSEDKLPLVSEKCALDCEWQPGSDQVAIISLALSTKVYIIDGIALRNSGPLCVFLEDLFQSGYVCAFGLHSDAQKIATSFPFVSASLHVVGFDVQQRATESLKSLTERALGVVLDKTMQQSDWEARPLSNAQRQYAALDAYVLTKLPEGRRVCCTTSTWGPGKLRAELELENVEHSIVAGTASVKTLCVIEDDDARVLCVIPPKMYLRLKSNQRIASSTHFGDFLQIKGGVGPISPDAAKVRTVVVDVSLRDSAILEVGAGHPRFTLRISPNELERYCTARSGKEFRWESIAVSEPIVGAACAKTKTPKHLRPKAVNSDWFRPFPSEEAYHQACESLPKSVLHKLDTLALEKRGRYVQFSTRFSAQREVYGNCELTAPDGTLLAKCDERKLRWYLRKGLAEEIGEKRIRLRFEPEGMKHYKDMSPAELALQTKADQFYVAPKENMCVVCGAETTYLRFHVVPTLYRKQFPVQYKSHASHDVVLLCVVCQEQASTMQHKILSQLAAEHNAPLDTHYLVKGSRKARSVAVALLRGGLALPAERRVNLKRELYELFPDIQPSVPSTTAPSPQEPPRIPRSSQQVEENGRLLSQTSPQQVEENRRLSRVSEAPRDLSFQAPPQQAEENGRLLSQMPLQQVENGRLPHVTEAPRDLPLETLPQPAEENGRRLSQTPLLQVEANGRLPHVTEAPRDLPSQTLPQQADENGRLLHVTDAPCNLPLQTSPQKSKRGRCKAAMEDDGPLRLLSPELSEVLFSPPYAITLDHLRCALTFKGKAEPRTHAPIVVGHYLQTQTLEDFIRMWRRIFLEQMAPAYLPAGWDLEAKVTRAFGKHSKFHRLHHVTEHGETSLAEESASAL